MITSISNILQKVISNIVGKKKCCKYIHTLVKNNHKCNLSWPAYMAMEQLLIKRTIPSVRCNQACYLKFNPPLVTSVQWSFSLVGCLYRYDDALIYINILIYLCGQLPDTIQPSVPTLASQLQASLLNYLLYTIDSLLQIIYFQAYLTLQSLQFHYKS